MLDNIRDNIHQVMEQGNSRSQLGRRQRRTNTRNRNMLFSTNPNGMNVNGINDTANLFNILRTRRLEPTFIDYLNTVVPVRPTNAQIQNATRETRYRDIVNPSNETCPISLERFEPNDLVTQIIHCGHIFCQTELQEWFQDNVRCPVCRYDIRDYTNTNETDTNETNTNEPNTNETNTNTNTMNTNTNTMNTNTSIPNISNMTFVRNPTTNQTEQIMFDFEVDNQFNNITSQIIQSLFSQNRNNIRPN
jgi:hypothetical protein